MHTGSDGDVVRFGPFSFDPETGDLHRNGSPVLLPPQPTKILRLLARSAGSIVSRSRITTELWDKAPPDPDQAINSAVAEIRTALDDDARDPEYIQTVPRKGYRLLIDQPISARLEEEISSEATRGTSGAIRAVALFGIGAAIILFGVRLLSEDAGRNDPDRIAVVPARVVTADSETDSLAAHLTRLLISSLSVSESGQVDVLAYRWDMKFDRDQGTITRDGRNMHVDYLLESSVDRDDGWELSVSVYGVEDGTQLWYRRYSAPVDSSVGIVEQVVNEVDSLIITNLSRRSSRVDES